MRVVVYGAGAVGGVVGGCLAENEHEVVLIARGAHAQATRDSGLVIESAAGTRTVDVQVVTGPEQIEFRSDDVVLLAMKSQDTRAALEALRSVAPRDTAIVCLQNGVENERAALRVFSRVYGVCVMCPTGHVHPCVVQAFSSPVTGILDIGRYPHGHDEVTEAVAAMFESATFVSEVRDDIMRWKYAKLLMNLSNAVEAVCGSAARQGPIAEMARTEGVACLRAAAIDFASQEEDTARRGDLLQVRPIAGQRRGGGSSWQSLARQAGSIESDYLNGEVVLLGRLHGVPTPVNALLQRLATELAARGDSPGAVSESAFMELLTREAE